MTDAIYCPLGTWGGRCICCRRRFHFMAFPAGVISDLYPRLHDQARVPMCSGCIHDDMRRCNSCGAWAPNVEPDVAELRMDMDCDELAAWMLEQLFHNGTLESGEDRTTVLLVALVQIEDHHVGVGDLVE